MHGSWVLVRMKGDRYGGKRNNWLLIKQRDAAAVEGKTDALMEEDRSVASGRRMADIEAGKGRGPEPFMLKQGGREGQCSLAFESRRHSASTAPAARATGRTRKAIWQVHESNRLQGQARTISPRVTLVPPAAPGRSFSKGVSRGPGMHQISGSILIRRLGSG
jgi:bifunctional non-homologous end joining protein LigD